MFRTNPIHRKGFGTLASIIVLAAILALFASRLEFDISVFDTELSTAYKLQQEKYFLESCQNVRSVMDPENPKNVFIHNAECPP